MAEERIDVKVTDSGADKAAKNLRTLANEADRGSTYVERLQAAMAAINASPLERLARASASASNALARELNAQSRLTAAQNASAASAARVAIAQAKLAAETAKAAAAQSRADIAAQQAAKSAIGLAVAQTQQATAAAKAAADADKVSASLKREKDALAALQAQAARPIVIHDANTVTPGTGGNLGGRAGSRALAGAQTETMAIDRIGGQARKATEELDKFTPALDRADKTAGRSRANMGNLAAQFNDIGVSLAGGQNPMLVFIQQGSQIAYIAGQMEQGWWGLTKASVAMLAPFTLIVAALGALYLGFQSFTSDMNSRHGPEMRKYAETLGLTDKEMRKLEGSTVSASGKVKEHSNIVITAGDTWNGFVATVKAGLAGLLAPFAVVGDAFSSTWQTATSIAGLAFKGFYASVITLLKLIGNSATNTVKIVLNAVIGIAEVAVMAIQGAINLVIKGINLLGDGANAIAEKVGRGKLVNAISEVNLGVQKLGQNMFALEKFDIGASFNEQLQIVDSTLKGFSARWEKETLAAYRKRIKETADAIIANRNPKAGKKDSTSDPKTQADYIKETTNALDQELGRMKMLKDAREVQTRLDQIEQEFLKRRMPLDKAQLDVFRQKITAIQQYKYQQAEMDRILEASEAPQRTMNAAVNAATDLLDRGAISAERYGMEVRKATRNYEEATDPLFSLREGLDAAQRAVGLYGAAVERNNVLEQARQALQAEGIPLYDLETGKLNSKVAALLAQNDQLVRQQQIQAQIGSIVNPMLEEQMMIDNKAAMYAEIDRLRQADVLSDANAQRARYALDAQYNELRLQGARGFFSEMAGLSSSGNAELAAIGKAAAMAQATMDGYVAVQKALASAPPPWNYAMAAAVALKTGMQVAGIASTNVGGFATGGQFIVGGRDGIDRNNINMDVTKGERVTIETKKQQKANDNQPQGARVTVPVKVVNVRTPGEALAEMDSDEGEEVIFNRLANSPNRLAAIINGVG